MLKRCLIMPLLVFFQFADPAIASDKHCSLIESNSERQSCYSQVSTPKSKDWLVAKSNHFKSITVSNTAIHDVKCGDVVGSTSIVFVCAEGKTKLTLTNSCVMGTKNEEIDVQFQIDDNSPLNVVMVVPNNSYALKMDDEGNTVKIIDSLLQGEQLHVSLPPSSHSTFTATFNIAGLESKLDPLRKACNLL